MNAIAAHKDELERLFVNLSRDTAVSGVGFVVAGCVYHAAPYEIAQTSAQASVRCRRKETEN
jgi:hypothetical protein